MAKDGNIFYNAILLNLWRIILEEYAGRIGFMCNLAVGKKESKFNKMTAQLK